MLRAPELRRRALIFGAAALSTVACTRGCERDARVASPPEGTAVTLPTAHPGSAPAVIPDASAPADAGAPPPHPGPFFTVTVGSTGIYAEPSPDRSRKLGYARSGGRIPVLPGTIAGEGCRAGWYRLVEGGFICGSDGNTDPDDPEVRLAVRPPDLNGILPYPYARNARNGTPLYSSVPSSDQIALYETSAAANDSEEPAELAWWQRKEGPPGDVRLAELEVSDGVLGRRMVKGFYIAVDTEFEWSSRRWFKTTKGMIAPQDRFVTVEGSEFHGVELDEEHSLPVAWTHGYREERPTYAVSDGKPRPLGVVPRLYPIFLSGERLESGGHRYLESRAGFWVRADHVRVVEPPPIPIDVTSRERWLHVDLRSQTLVALIGSHPVFTTLVSSGKEHEQEDKDHRTPPGEWHIREKHVTTTMDGDGSAAGDLPYSIEDVPYVMYFKGSYALHGAFWHGNYGVRMSHGCINLAPLDAKRLFFFTGPPVREGWHGAWAGNGQPGSRVVIDGPSRDASARR